MIGGGGNDIELSRLTQINFMTYRRAVGYT
jgi:hypothetical protein